MEKSIAWIRKNNSLINTLLLLILISLLIIDFGVKLNDYSGKAGEIDHP